MPVGWSFVEFEFVECLQENDEILFETYARIEHVISGFWLHALRGEYRWLRLSVL